jgi:hypothetical protein
MDLKDVQVVMALPIQLVTNVVVMEKLIAMSVVVVVKIMKIILVTIVVEKVKILAQLVTVPDT